MQLIFMLLLSLFIWVRFGLMKRVMIVVSFKDFLAWCVHFSLTTQRPLGIYLFKLMRFAVYLKFYSRRNWIIHCTLQVFCSNTFVYFFFFSFSFLPSLLILVNDQNKRKSELNSFLICFSLSSYLYFLVTKKSMRLQVFIPRLGWMHILFYFLSLHNIIIK